MRHVGADQLQHGMHCLCGNDNSKQFADMWGLRDSNIASLQWTCTGGLCCQLSTLGINIRQWVGDSYTFAFRHDTHHQWLSRKMLDRHQRKVVIYGGPFPSTGEWTSFLPYIVVLIFHVVLHKTARTLPGVHTCLILPIALQLASF